jgi:hypothetical protein
MQAFNPVAPNLWGHHPFWQASISKKCILCFLTVVKLQLWSSNEMILWLGGHHNMRNCYRVSALGRMKTTALTWVPHPYLHEIIFKVIQYQNHMHFTWTSLTPFLITASSFQSKPSNQGRLSMLYHIIAAHVAASNLGLLLLQSPVQIFCLKLVGWSGVLQLLHAWNYRSPRVYHYLCSDMI